MVEAAVAFPVLLMVALGLLQFALFILPVLFVVLLLPAAVELMRLGG